VWSLSQWQAWLVEAQQIFHGLVQRDTVPDPVEVQMQRSPVSEQEKSRQRQPPKVVLGYPLIAQQSGAALNVEDGQLPPVEPGPQWCPSSVTH